MPAVDPLRLAQDTRQLLEQLDDPEAFTRAVLERLEFYSDHAKRPGTADELAGGELAFRVRPPVLRSLRRDFSRAASERPTQALRAARQLWESGWREARILAAGMLPGAAAARQVGQWAEATEDRQVLQELADAGLAGARRRSSAGFLRAVRTWLRQGRERPRLLALLALRGAALDPDFPDLPGLLRAVEGAATEVRGESRRALRTLIEALAQRSPAEAARFLLEEFGRQPAALAPILQQSLPAFPERQRAVLQERLSTHRRTGIMPAS
jgi:hypothetical protein